jgi:hypothetical protein
LVTGCFPALAQQPATVTDDDFQKVLVAVSSEDWDAAVSLSSRLLKQMKDEDKRLPRLRYIYLYAAAGKVTNGNMEFDDLAKLAKELIGKPVEVPYRPITLQCRGAFNFICPSGDKNDRIMVAASNKTATSILAFEYTQLKEPFDFQHHVDETASISGTIDSIVPNPNKSRAIVLRLFISNGVLNLKDKPPETNIAPNSGQLIVARYLTAARWRRARFLKECLAPFQGRDRSEPVVFAALRPPATLFANPSGCMPEPGFKNRAEQDHLIRSAQLV